MEQVSLTKLKTAVIKEYDSRQLKSNVRYRALHKIIRFIETQYKGSTDCLNSVDKETMKNLYVRFMGKEVTNGAESSAFNELYNQYNFLKQEHEKVD